MITTAQWLYVGHTGCPIMLVSCPAIAPASGGRLLHGPAQLVNPHTITFDTLASGTEVDNQFLEYGVQFLPNGTSSVPIASNLGVITQSPPNALANWVVYPANSSNAPLQMEFTTPMQAVGVYLGNGPASATMTYMITSVLTTMPYALTIPVPAPPG